MAFIYKIHILDRAILWRNDYKHICDDVLTNKFTTSELNFNNTLYNFNFDYNDGINANITIPLSESTNDDIFLKSSLSMQEALQKQYCIIEETNDETAEKKKYFYFITSAKISNLYVIKYSLELDIFTTYYNKDKFKNGVVKRALVDRWQLDGDNVRFNNSADTKIYNIDDNIEASKKLNTSQKIKFQFHHWNANADDLDTWLNANIVAWKYLYIQSDKQYNYKDASGQSATASYIQNGAVIGDIEESYSIIAIPIYKTNRKIFLRTSAQAFAVDDSALYDFLSVNNNYSYVYAVKISNTPPFIIPKDAQSDYNFTYSIIAGSLYIDATTIEATNNNLLRYQSLERGGIITNYQDFKAIFNVAYQTKTPLKSELLNVGYISKFTKNEIKNGYKNYFFEPSAWCQKRFELRLTYNGQVYTKNAMNLQSDKLQLMYYEPLTLGITKINIKWYSDINTSSAIFNKNNNDIIGGFIISDDTSLTTANDKLSEVLANNKNYFLQQQIGIATSYAKSGVNSIVGGKLDLMGFVSSGIKEINTNLENENLENSPSRLVSASGNIEFNNLIHDLGVYLEVWQTTDAYIRQSGEYYYKNGNYINEIGDLATYSNTRKYFNYIEYEDFKIIDLQLNNDIIEKFKSAFNSGLTLWHSANNFLDYAPQNYEIYLD